MHWSFSLRAVHGHLTGGGPTIWGCTTYACCNLRYVFIGSIHLSELMIKPSLTCLPTVFLVLPPIATRSCLLLRLDLFTVPNGSKILNFVHWEPSHKICWRGQTKPIKEFSSIWLSGKQKRALYPVWSNWDSGILNIFPGFGGPDDYES